MLIILMYHQVINTAQPTKIDDFYEHLRYLKNTFDIVLPGEDVSSTANHVCLSFDDAYFDFYHTVYPMLKSENIRAVLGVPTAYIVNDTDLSPSARLNIKHGCEMEKDRFKTQVPFCTWKELKEMSDSPFVQLASHSHRHVSMTNHTTNIDSECQLSKQLLLEHTGALPNTFIYPYGAYCAKVNESVLSHYPYTMRIGQAVNKNWGNAHAVCYRINADEFWTRKRKWTLKDTVKHRIKYHANILRKK